LAAYRNLTRQYQWQLSNRPPLKLWEPKAIDDPKSSLRYPQGIKERSDEAIFQCLRDIWRLLRCSQCIRCAHGLGPARNDYLWQDIAAHWTPLVSAIGTPLPITVFFSGGGQGSQDFSLTDLFHAARNEKSRLNAFKPAFRSLAPCPGPELMTYCGAAPDAGSCRGCARCGRLRDRSRSR
jgi:hypothetical protein